MKDDKPAFPNTITEGPAGDRTWPHEHGLGGLTRRELFAAMVAQGIAAQAIAFGTSLGVLNEHITQAIAGSSAAIADALIAELDKEES